MNILVITQSEWDDRRAGGNTLSNWFTGWKNVTFFSIYPRAAQPLNRCCKDYWSVSPVSIIKCLLTPWRIGNHLLFEDYPADTEDQSKEKSIITFAHRTSNKLFYLVNEILFKSKIWQNKRYKSYIEKVKPDVVFTFGLGDSFIIKNVEFIKKRYGSKIIVFVADDVNGVYINNNTLYDRICKHNLDALIGKADVLFGASELLCKEYSSIFGRSFTPLYKGCIIQEARHDVNSPLRIAYAGNLYYGRLETLEVIARAIKCINDDNNKVLCKLYIYTGATITEDINRRLNIKNACEIVGRKPYQEIMGILHESDVVLHVESFEEKNIKTVRLSFSTKIMDCLQSGATLMVIGPSNIASVDYARYIPGAIVVNNIEEIRNVLVEIITSSSKLPQRAMAINSFAKKHHDINQVRTYLQDEFFNNEHCCPVKTGQKFFEIIEN